MNRSAFYAHLRKRGSGVFGTSLSQRQVEGVEAILTEGSHLPSSYLAHVLAETYHETGGGMYPVKETVFRHSKNQNPPDALVIARLNKAYAAGKLPWVTRVYWRDGWFGRGGVQITHEDNYRKLSPYVGVDLVANPDAALDPVISAKIAIAGMEHGLFTGERLSDFDKPSGFDHEDARSMVNGDERRPVGNGLDLGDKIEGYARAFEAALDAAGYAPKPQPAPTPPEQPQSPPMGFWARLFAAIFGGRNV